jgi:hypothetical protein
MYGHHKDITNVGCILTEPSQRSGHYSRTFYRSNKLLNNNKKSSTRFFQMWHSGGVKPQPSAR